jgi:trk system potassium uptake protein TrkA
MASVVTSPPDFQAVATALDCAGERGNMNVVIVGAGEVGTHLARMLSREAHNIVLMDDDKEKLSKVSGDVDLLTVTGSAHLFSDLKETGVKDADLFIAVTPSEERNVLACTMASYLGAKRTVARINNSEYLQGEYREQLRAVGVSELIYPERLAAAEIVSSMKLTGARQVVEFSDAKLILLGIKIRSNASVVDQTLQELSSHYSDIIAVAINRARKTIIPYGNDYIRDGDIVLFVTTPANQQTVFTIAGKELYHISNIMFLGGSRIAQKAIERLGDRYSIKVIEANRERCERIADRFRKVLVIHGDGRDMALLNEEGLEKMDALVATTGNSETNIIACHLAKSRGVRRTVAEVENFDFMAIAEGMDIGRLINKKLIAASHIYRFTLKAAIANVTCLTVSDAEVFEFIAKPGSRVTRKTVRDLGFPAEAIIGGVIRENQGFIAKGDTQIQEGDRVVVFTLPSGIRKLDKFFR